jgi:hypothetical protein
VSQSNSPDFGCKITARLMIRVARSDDHLGKREKMGED